MVATRPSTRFSPLKQINDGNVDRLEVNWVFQTGVPGKYEATPLFEKGILYFTGPAGHAWALDARTGRIEPPKFQCAGRKYRFQRLRPHHF